jgi:hypothetical protein
MIQLCLKVFSRPSGGLIDSLLSLAFLEANALNSWVGGRRAPAEPQLMFRRKLTGGILENHLDSEGIYRKNSGATLKQKNMSPG